MRVLLATKGSTHSAVARQWLKESARTIKIDGTILTVIKESDNRQRIEELLRQEIADLETAVNSVNAVIRTGDVAAEIIRAAETGDYDLIVMGERVSHSLLTRLIGSTTQRVIGQMPCPVLIAKHRAAPVRRILLCDSGRVTPTLLQRLTQQLPEILAEDEDITVLHVMSQISAAPGVRGTQLRAEADELIAEHAPEGEILEADVEFLTQVGVESRAKVRHGLVVDEIMEEARAGDYDLVVIGAHEQEDGWTNFLLDNLARQIVMQCDRPILVIR